MLYTYSLYGLQVQLDFSFPFLEPLSNNTKPNITVSCDNSLQLNHSIELNETLSDLNLRDANIENRYYKCIIKDGSSIKYKFKESLHNNSLLINFLHMPFAFAMFQRGYLPIHGMSFLDNKKVIISSGMSESGKSTLTSNISKTHKVRSEDITCVIYKNNKTYSMPSFPILLSEEAHSKHLKRFSSSKVSRERTINLLSDRYDDKNLVEVKRIYILEWGDYDEIKILEDGEALKKLLISSFKPYPFNNCIDSERVYFKNMMGLIRHNKIYLYTRKKNKDLYSHINLIKHIKNDSS